MKNAIKKIIESLYPEIKAGLHLPIKAQIINISDSPKSPVMSNQFRPYYAVDVKPLGNLPVFYGLPLPDTGLLSVPRPGQFVEIAFFNGSPSQPFIRTVLTENQLLPEHYPGETCLGNSESFIKIDSAGNQQRKTTGDINDTASHLTQTAIEKTENFNKRKTQIAGNDTAEIKGDKIIEALGQVDIIAGEKINLGTLQALVILAAKEISLESRTKAELTAPKITIGNGKEELLNLVKDLSNEVKTVISDLKALQQAYNTHKNPNRGQNPPDKTVSPTQASVASMQSSLDKIKV